MLTKIKNKMVVDEKTKSTEQIKIKEKPLIEVYFKNTTVIQWKIYQKWIARLTSQEYELIKKFL